MTSYAVHAWKVRGTKFCENHSSGSWGVGEKLAPQIKCPSLQTDVNQTYIVHRACGEICKEWSFKKITHMEV